MKIVVALACLIMLAGCQTVIPASMNKSSCDFDYTIGNQHVKVHRETNKNGVN